MSEPSIKIYTNDGVRTVLLGKAPEPVNYGKANYDCDYYSVFAYAAHRLETQVISINEALVKFWKKSKSITLFTHENASNALTVIGSIVENSELAVFGINADKYWTKDEIAHLFRMNQHLFFDRASIPALVQKLEKFSLQNTVKFQADTENAKRGNSAISVQRQTETDLFERFLLKCPVYQGFPDEAFEVELCFEVQGNAVRFWFESVELRAKELESYESAYHAQKANFIGLGFLVIEE